MVKRYIHKQSRSSMIIVRYCLNCEIKIHVVYMGILAIENIKDKWNRV